MIKRPKAWAVSIALLIALLIMVGLVWANHRYITLSSGENSFVAGWLGTRLLLTKGWNPYSSETTAEIQQAVYNRPARTGENQLYFLYPYYAGLFFFPFSLTSDVTLARVAWMTLLELALFASLAVSILLSQWRAPAWALAIMLVFSLVWYYGVRAVLDGDLVVLALLFIVIALLAIRAEHDALAGFFLLLATIKPPAVILLIICVLIWAGSSRRWTIVWSFLGGLVLIIAAGSLLTPSWTVDFVRQLIRHFRSAEINTLSGVLFSWLPGIGRQLAWVITGLAIVGLIFEWRRTIGKDARWFHWAACLTLAVTPLSGLPVTLNDFVIILPGLALIFAIWEERWGALGKASIIISSLGLSLGLWWLVFYGLQEGMLPDHNPWLYLLAPAFMLGGIYWVRWWAIRPPRLPLEELSGQLSA